MTIYSKYLLPIVGSSLLRSESFLFPLCGKFGERTVLIVSFSFSRWGSGEPQVDQIGELSKDDKMDPDAKDGKRTGQILWIRGLTRLQTQVRDRRSRSFRRRLARLGNQYVFAVAVEVFIVKII